MLPEGLDGVKHIAHDHVLTDGPVRVKRAKQAGLLSLHHHRELNYCPPVFMYLFGFFFFCIKHLRLHYCPVAVIMKQFSHTVFHPQA